VGYKYKDLIVWQRSKALASEIYRITENFPKSELYGLTSQVRRAAVSVPSNIAEGQGRLTRGEFQQFLGHARGSLLELETQLSIAVDLRFLDAREFAAVEPRIAEINRLLNGLLESLRSRGKSAGAG
jgi:four helix bundle protein